jgi:hypothetical protein
MISFVPSIKLYEKNMVDNHWWTFTDDFNFDDKCLVG